MPQDSPYEITWLIRRLFRAMAARADQYLADADLRAADRAVMEFLYPDLALSVPQIARRYTVSRQHVQVTANELVDRGLLRAEENPKHKRSSLLRLSAAGVRRFESIRQAETELLDRLFDGFSDSDLDTTRKTLRSLLERLA